MISISRIYLEKENRQNILECNINLYKFDSKLMLIDIRGGKQGRDVKITGLYCRHWLSHFGITGKAPAYPVPSFYQTVDTGFIS